MIRNICPADLHPLAPILVSSGAEIESVVAQARAALPAWSALSLNERAKLLRKAAKRMLARRQEVLELMHDEIGKLPGEALMNEAIGPLQFVNDCVKLVRPYLKSRRLPMSPLAFPGKSGKIEVMPRGVVGIIAPWNFPLAYFFKPVFPALLCGNTAVIKPSEYAPRTALWFAGILNEFLPAGVLSCVVGDREVGTKLIGAGIDAITFTGSFKSGREVAKLAAERMIPCSSELGGKDAAIVLADCALDRTVAGIRQWGLNNAGQACGAIDRVYVEAPIADAFVEKLRFSVTGAQVGPIAHEAQLKFVESLVADALAKGAVLVCGGRRSGRGFFYEPTVLDRCDHSMRICTEPSFGPVIPIVRVADEEEALQLANSSDYGLCGSVWSQDRKRASRLASRLEVGTAFVNNHAFTGGVIAAPWTGVKQTGTGVANSTFGLAHYTRPRTQVVDRSKAFDIYWFPINGTLEELGHLLAEAQLGKLWSAIRLPWVMSQRKREIVSAAAAAALPGAELSRLKLPTRLAVPAELKRFRLSAYERAWLVASFETIFVEKSEMKLPPLAKGEAPDLLEDFLSSVSLVNRVGIRAMIWVAGWSPLLTRNGWTTLTRASPEARFRSLNALFKGDAFLPRQVTLVLKTLGALAHAKTTRIVPAETSAPRDRVALRRPESAPSPAQPHVEA